MPRTRIKICGLTRPQDIVAAVEQGADAIGFVFYPPSPRCLSLERARELARHVPPFVTLVGLFVNEPRRVVQEALAALPLQLLQFHGEEPPEYCESFGRPYLKAARVRPGFDLLEYAAHYPGAAGLLLDSFVTAYGGVGQGFDWSLIPSGLPLPVVLSGGLDADNVGEAIARVRPWGVDVSSGVESAKGIKDRDKIAAFIAGVRDADSRTSL